MRQTARLLAGVAFGVCVALALAGCGGGASSLTNSFPPPDQNHPSGSTPIKHVIMIVKENRSFDNLFATFPGVNGATRGQEKLKKGGKYIRRWVTLKPTPLVLSYDLAHCRPAFLLDYDKGKMDGGPK